MNRLLRVAGLATAITLSASTGAEAQITLTGSPPCANSSFTFYTTSTSGAATFQCAGAFSGNSAGPAGRTFVSDYIATVWGLPSAYLGTNTAGSDVGPLGSFANAPSGNLSFDDPIVGQFALALKANSFFSLFLFDTGGQAWTSLDYDTYGVAVNANGKAQGLSNASLHQVATVTPEPTTVILLGTGLLGLALVGARRREQDEA